MTSSFDPLAWQEIIQKSDWYFDLDKLLRAAHAELGPDSEELVSLRRQVRKFFEKQLLAGNVYLASKGPDLDDQRMPIDTIVIHHTSSPPGYRLSYMNAVHLTNIYVPYFAKPTDPRELHLKGKPIWSGHFKDGRQVFYGYHWFMRTDGNLERLLPDAAIGWHAGNWDINKRSIGICIDDDYQDHDPPAELLEKLAGFINEQYPSIKASRIIGHREAREGTNCPGSNFLDGWKTNLLKLIKG